MKNIQNFLTGLMLALAISSTSVDFALAGPGPDKSSRTDEMQVCQDSKKSTDKQTPFYKKAWFLIGAPVVTALAFWTGFRLYKGKKVIPFGGGGSGSSGDEPGNGNNERQRNNPNNTTGKVLLCIIELPGDSANTHKLHTASMDNNQHGYIRVDADQTKSYSPSSDLLKNIFSNTEDIKNLGHNVKDEYLFLEVYFETGTTPKFKEGITAKCHSYTPSQIPVQALENSDGFTGPSLWPTPHP